MPRFKITIEYDGTNYAGWQRQPDQISIQEIIENALEKSFNKKIEIFASGRTDAGVHAFGQIAHFDLDKNIGEFQLMMSINQNIGFNHPISITNCEIVADDFNARFHAKLRSYQYKIINRRAKLALDVNRVWQIPKEIDIKKMQEASKYLIGKHDFSSFRDSECQSQNPIRTIKDIKITKIDDLITIDVSAKSFLHHMVRNIVGTLFYVGKDKITVKDVEKILKAKDRTLSGPNAPACGLYFMEVQY